MALCHIREQANDQNAEKYSFVDRICVHLAMKPSSNLGSKVTNRDAPGDEDTGTEKQQLLQTKWSIDALPLPPLAHGDAQWEGNLCQIEFIVDNQTVADLSCGRAVVELERYKPRVKKIVDLIESFFLQGWRPRYTMFPVVWWRPRRCNILVDLMYKLAMSRQEDINFM